MSTFFASVFERTAINKLIRKSFGDDFPDIFFSERHEGFFHYLSRLGSRVVVMECNYLGDYLLEDCSRYYHNQSRGEFEGCVRLHFFSCEPCCVFDDAVLDFCQECFAENLKFESSYLGFLVLKPLPRAFWGGARVRATPDGVFESARHRMRECEVELFGSVIRFRSKVFCYKIGVGNQSSNKILLRWADSQRNLSCGKRVFNV